ncbi:MAG: histidine kinase [Clostridiales bacterium]|nr:histidine kinase [Clostridiales bacterium]
MARFHGMPYRVKMILLYSVTIVAVVGMITLTLTLTASRQVLMDKMAHLNLLTEQVLMSFSDGTSAAAQQLLTMASGKGVSSQMYAMRNLRQDEQGYYQNAQSLLYAINQMITTQSFYDSLYVRLDGGLSFTNSFAQEDFVAAASALLNSEPYGNNTYGRALWTRGAGGEVYLVRDVYNLSPIRHVGKMVARIRRDMLAGLGTHNGSLNSTVVFLDADGHTIDIIGGSDEALAAAAETAAQANLTEVKVGDPYAVSIQRGENWTAVGFLPKATLNSVSQAVIRTGLIVGMLGILLGALAVMAVTQRMTRQMRLLVKSMDEVSAGNMDLTVPIEAGDEIGQMAAHFNRMIAQTRELLARVVQEENRKSKAEYEMLEYKYRSLQSQINPHFIYNAMETVNALAKLDGNDEICDVVRHISAFFRQNTGNMQKRFITVRREFDSLKQYAHIYHHIHGNSLSTPFTCSPAAAEALIPTMILQPVIENALVHGVRPAEDEAVVSINATDTPDGRLVIDVRDNGSGMPAGLVEQILQSPASEPMSDGRAATGIGMRNVRDRLRLIYGERAVLSIESRENEGTLVSIGIPLVYDEEELGHNPNY